VPDLGAALAEAEARGEEHLWQLLAGAASSWYRLLRSLAEICRRPAGSYGDDRPGAPAMAAADGEL
jgi:hypothetical protein